jgi:hypothetical protein
VSTISRIDNHVKFRPIPRSQKSWNVAGQHDFSGNQHLAGVSLLFVVEHWILISKELRGLVFYTRLRERGDAVAPTGRNALRTRCGNHGPDQAVGAEPSEMARGEMMPQDPEPRACAREMSGQGLGFSGCLQG